MNAVVKMEHKSIQSRLADRFGVNPSEVLSVLKQTAFKVRGNESVQATDAQMTALMIVADQYKLNPFTKELYAYPDKQNGIVPVVSVDGWARIINEHPAMNGIEFVYSAESVIMAGGKPCPAWCDCIIYRKDREKPTIIREYLDEVYCGKRGDYSGPWQSHTKRMLRHKTLIQCSRIAFGFAGIYDDDEALRIIERDVTGEVDVTPVKQVEGVKAKSERAPVVHEQAPEVISAEPADKPSTTTLPMSAGQKRILKAKLTNSGLNDVDLKADFGMTMDDEGWTFDHFAAIQEWIKDRASA